MKETPQHTYQILTKRADRMAEMTTNGSLEVLPNIWLGTSIEDSSVFDRLEYLRETRATIRFVSFEPLLGSVKGADLTNINWAIVGGESGPRARAMKSTWVDEIETMCAEQEIAFFFKQWGGIRKNQTGRLRSGRTFDSMPNHCGITVP